MDRPILVVASGKTLNVWSVYFVCVCVKTPVQIIGKPQPATPSQPATPGTSLECQQYRKSDKAHKHDFVFYKP